MEIIRNLEGQEIPIIGTEEYLSTINGVLERGYFVEKGFALPFTIRHRLCFKWMQLDCPTICLGGGINEIDFLNNVVEYVKKNFQITHIATANTAIFNVYPTGSYYCKFGSYLVDLSKSEEELFKSLHSKHRNVVRKAQTNGIQIFHGKEYAKDAINLMQQTFARQNKVTGLGESFIKRHSALGDYIDYWVAKSSDGTLQGSAIFAWKEGTSSYYLHGGSAAHTDPGAMNLLIWEAMKEMKVRGVKIFDFVGARVTTEPGSKLEGIQRFKSRFGAEMKVGYIFRVVINKPYYWTYKFLLGLFFLLKERKLMGDAITTERKKGNM